MACGATLTLKRSLEFDPLHGRVAKRQRCMPTSVTSQMSPVQQRSTASPFAEVVPKLSTDQIAAQISFEIKRLQHKRRGLFRGSSPSLVGSGSNTPPQISASPSTSSMSQTLSTLGLSGSASQNVDTPLLSLRQVGLVCERLLKEREEQLREEYDKVLNDKLTEQYEAFLRFNHDQLNRRFGETAASYVS